MRVDKEAVMKHTTSGSSSPTFLFKMFMVIVFIMIHYDTNSECQPCSLCIASIKMGKIKAIFIVYFYKSAQETVYSLNCTKGMA